MKISEILTLASDKLSDIDNSSNEARWMLESVLDCSSSYIFLHADDEVEECAVERYFKDIDKRKSGMPIQYIIGEWDFYGRSYCVGPGVLIPRPETELLVDKAVQYISSGKCSRVLDLCAGTGCIGISLAAEFPDVEVVSVEKYAPAFEYLEKNISRYGLKNIKALRCDVFKDAEMICEGKFDLIISNPPYINSSDIPHLQSEVQVEPATALDGGTDGLDFYRCYAENYTADCTGAFLFECGENQAEDICRMFVRYGRSEAFNDFNGTERVVFIERNYE